MNTITERTKPKPLEWISENSEGYFKIMLLNHPEHPLMQTPVGVTVDCYLEGLYARVKEGKGLVFDAIPRVQCAVNLVDHPEIAGEYIINRFIATDVTGDVKRFLVSHKQEVGLDFVNHVIDLNRPDELNPQLVLFNDDGFKQVISFWGEQGWLKETIVSSIMSLSSGDADVLDERIVDLVLANPGFQEALRAWRAEHFLTEASVASYVKSGEPLFTIEDELSFAVEIRANKEVEDIYEGDAK